MFVLKVFGSLVVLGFGSYVAGFLLMSGYTLWDRWRSSRPLSKADQALMARLELEELEDRVRQQRVFDEYRERQRGGAASHPQGE